MFSVLMSSGPRNGLLTGCSKNLASGLVTAYYLSYRNVSLGVEDRVASGLWCEGTIGMSHEVRIAVLPNPSTLAGAVNDQIRLYRLEQEGEIGN